MIISNHNTKVICGKGGYHGFFQRTDDGGRTRAFLIRHACVGRRSFQGKRRKDGTDSGTADFRQAAGSVSGCRRHGSDPVVFRNDSDGGGICQFRHHETVQCHWHHHGCQYRYYRYLMAVKSEWY